MSQLFNVIAIIIFTLLWSLPLITIGSRLLVLEFFIGIVLMIFKIEYDYPLGGWCFEKAFDWPIGD